MTLLLLGSIAACLCLLYKLLQVISRADPLSHIPGPWYTRYTSLVFTFNSLVPRVHVYVDNLHRIYGPVVRLSPTMVAVADPDGIQDIYRTSRGYLKGPIYDSLIRSFFATRDPVLHGQRRRLFARPLANSSLLTHWANEIRGRVQLAVERIKTDGESDSNGEADAYKWWNIMANDVITRMSFGESLDLLESDEHMPYIEAVKKTLRCSSLNRNFPRLMPLLKYLPIPRLQEILTARPKTERYTSKAVSNFRQHSKTQSNPRNIFTQIVAQAEGEQDNKAVQVISDEDLHSEALTLMLGGTDSTSSTLTYATWAVLSHPEVQQRLEEEVAILSSDLTSTELEGARYLNAVIHETLRLHGPVAVGLQRVTPPSGAHIAGFELPAGTVVWPQMYTTRYDPTIWPEPLKFDPDRFLDVKLPSMAEGNLTPAQKKTYVPFGGGTRMCLGMNLAYLELRFGLAFFFRKCRGARLSERMSPDDMAPDHFFVSSPKGRRCLIKLAR
ncbi:cytochrome P450 [Teratosphaeria nubilosa]|uniref:Cytochrome P450 n=1 Tax=Teratosphaeria nubilosa TaxID=161662 RepID=A0A6G1LE82_9PEZI|nr:cytochrome P450 [Teratosphaeria nubilosa]